MKRYDIIINVKALYCYKCGKEVEHPFNVSAGSFEPDRLFILHEGCAGEEVVDRKTGLTQL